MTLARQWTCTSPASGEQHILLLCLQYAWQRASQGCAPNDVCHHSPAIHGRSRDPRLTSLSSCCSSWTNKLITAKDHAAVQLNVGHLDENGVYTGSYTTFAFAGNVRAMVSLASWPLQPSVQAFLPWQCSIDAASAALCLPCP